MSRPVPSMTYNVFDGTLNLALSIYVSRQSKSSQKAREVVLVGYVVYGGWWGKVCGRGNN